MADDIIKNPKRLIPVEQKPYEPEYLKKNIDVQSYSISSTLLEEVKYKPSATEMFASFDDNFVDVDGDESKYNNHIIDNNDYVGFGLQEKHTTQTTAEKKIENSCSPKIGDYILMVFGKLIVSGPLSEIEEKVKNIIYGDDKDYSNTEVSTDDIVVLKRVNIKVGIFIDG